MHQAVKTDIDRYVFFILQLGTSTKYIQKNWIRQSKSTKSIECKVDTENCHFLNEKLVFKKCFIFNFLNHL